MEKSFELNPEFVSKINWFSFGCVVSDNHFVHHFTSDSKFSEIQILFQNYKKKLSIQLKTSLRERLVSVNPLDAFTSSSDSETTSSVNPIYEWFEEKYEFVVNYSQIKSIDFKDNKIVFKLLFPPLLYQICEEDREESEEEYVSQREDITEEGFKSESTKGETTTGLDSGIESSEDFSDCSDVYDIRSETSETKTEVNSSNFRGFRLRTNGLLDINELNFTKINSICVELTNDSLANIISNINAFEPLIITQEKFFQMIESKDIALDLSPVSGLTFDILYSLTALTNHSFYFIDSLIFNNNSFEEFVDLVKELTKSNEQSVDRALNDLRVKIENNLDMNPIKDLINSFNQYKDQKAEKWTNSDVMSVRRCILTPTRLLLLPALPLQQNRFLRISDPNYVLRVLIKDEDFQQLSFTTCKTSLPELHEFVTKMKTFLNETIFDRLINGIEISGRSYKVLGASTSQLRDHGLVLYACDDQHRDVQHICQQIGELNHIRNAGKYIARIGQSMSQSMTFVPNVNCVEIIDDIKGGEHEITKNAYIFSDGVGMISGDMAQELCSVLRIQNVSTFQIRYGGCKGILVVNPKLKGKQILIRNSMKKFESKSTDLDVLKVSETRSCYLNRPLITILNQMGVSNEQLLKLLFQRHKQLANAFSCDCNAIQLMTEYSGLKLDFKKLLDSGIDVLSEPFFVSIIQSIITKVSLDLKNKARILVPLDSARVMFGVLDETNTLDYGQVFVQYSHLQSGNKRILSGEVLVTKYPCMHPGDVRKLIAVDVPALHHIVDCIVFPARGQRPHPDEMAGSDLDGDEYSVIWYSDLVFQRNNSKPMYFPSGEAEDLGRAVTTSDILSFFCRFIANNQVGLIASSHLVWADCHSEGIFSHICRDLDNKYATALDFAKTGINARLRNNQKPNKYPDFMQKYNEKPTYKSSKALGKLYQKNCYFHQIINEFSKQICFDFKPNPKLIDKNASIYMKGAENMFHSYCKAINELKLQFGIESESALVSATFIKTHKYLSTQNDSNDIHDLISNIIKRLFNDFLEKFESEDNDEDKRLSKASAWYLVCHKNNSQTTEEYDKYYGFPWIVSKYLMKLSLKNGSQKHDCSQQTIKSNENQNEIYSQKTIQSIVNLFFNNYFENMSIIENKYIEQTVKEVVEKYGSDIPSTVLIEIFDKFIDNFEVYKENAENDWPFDVAFFALMAQNKLKRLGFAKAVQNEYQISIQTKESNFNNCVFVATITDNLSKNLEFNEQLFENIMKKKTGIKQMSIKYGFEGQDSVICVYGSQKSIEKFRQFIINPYLSHELELIFNEMIIKSNSESKDI